MKKLTFLLSAFVLTIAAQAQTLNVTTGNVTYQFPAVQTGEMTYTDGTTLTICGKQFAISDIDKIYTDQTVVTNNEVTVIYNSNTAKVTVAGNVAQYVTPTLSGAHVSIDQSNTEAVDDDEITYILSGTTTDGGLDLYGEYKCTVSLAGLTLTNPNGAAINITNKKRIQLSVKKDTENTLTDCVDGEQKACIYSKGQLQLQGNGTLNVVGKTKHGIKSASYISIKNLTLNITSTVGDGISCEEYFQMKSGAVTISGIGDDGIQCDIDDTQTGEIVKTDLLDAHEDEDGGNMYFEGGTLTINSAATAAKGIKADGNINISDGTISINTSGIGSYDAEERDAKGAAGLSADGNITISGGTVTTQSTGTGGKGIKADGTLTISGGTITATTTGSKYSYSTTTSSPKAIKSTGAMTISGGTITASSENHEGIESKNTLTVTGGHIYAAGGNDGVNSAGNMYLKGGYIFAHSTGTDTGADGFDANGNLYVQGATAYGIAHGTPDVAFDANSEGRKVLYVESGNLVAIAGIESGASLTQSCYQANSYTKDTWYGLYNNDILVLAFQVPATGTMGSPMVVSTSGATTLKSGITVTRGTNIWDGYGYIDATVTGGTNVGLTDYTGGGGGDPFGGGGGPGGGPGGGDPPGGGGFHK